MLLSQCTNPSSISPWGRQYITHFQFELLLYFLLAGRGQQEGRGGAAFQLSQTALVRLLVTSL